MESLLKENGIGQHFPTGILQGWMNPLALPHIGLKPAGYYAVGYIYGNYDSVDELYERINAYIEEIAWPLTAAATGNPYWMRSLSGTRMIIC